MVAPFNPLTGIANINQRFNPITPNTNQIRTQVGPGRGAGSAITSQPIGGPPSVDPNTRRQAFLNQNAPQPIRPAQQGGPLTQNQFDNAQDDQARQAMLAQQAQQQAQQQQFGLSGAELALSQGFQGAAGALNAGATNAVQTLGGDFGAGAGQVQGDFNVNAQNVNPLTGQPLFQQAAQGVNQFSGAGVQAQQQQAALSGALGNEAQQAAFAAFNESPGQAFLREQGLRQVTNAASATGGLVGGNVLSELQRQGQGLAQQDFQNQFNRLGSLSSQGLQAAGQAGQFLSQAGQQQGNLAAQNAQLGTQANLASAANRLSAESTNAQLGTQAGIASAANRLSAAGQQAGFQNQQGVNIGNLFQSTGQNVAQNRFQAGRDIASQIGQGTSALSNLAAAQGAGLSDLIGSGAGNIANLLSGAGQFSAQQQQQMAQILANISTGQGTQLSNIAQQQGVHQANSAIRQGQNTQNLLGNLTSAAGVFAGNQAPSTSSALIGVS